MLCFCSILHQPYWLSLSLTVLLPSFWKNVVFLEMQILEGVIMSTLFGAPHKIFKVTPEQDLKIFRGLYPRIRSFFLRIPVQWL